MRLADTELALYEALATLRTMSASSLVRASRKADLSRKQKAARMEEWAQLPLREPSDLERWLDSKRDNFTIMNDVGDARQTMPLDAILSSDSATRRQNSQPSNTSGMLIGTNSPDGARSGQVVTLSSTPNNPQMSVDQATSPSTPGRNPWRETSRHGLPEQIPGSSGEVMMLEDNRMGKAGQLSKWHPAIYF
ncbi:uncharacterized protein NFIA_094610 [Aspergillus fischeri NRRL 181]|uniref:Uncharacterized protein n=1 Tax=Neosartorya fischeri (strain ATCC 1020 / DSM 3700 / CBS 544.65 / FGSC A1164 / JCM 1740 / NRRL 181 / WB 181) TaxID=331117 RepID=A1DAF1_NEOFI|nr:uncharacterized protein NFIA_094610 [Aspergillus fischeri NRRL 181]EAW19841.1 hypothetical protein NFIA_094610 [Aspergillus fischeri NRRL 181]